MNEKGRISFFSDSGSTLLSVLFILTFLSFLFSSISGGVKNQIHQYKQTAYSYEAKALIEMTETLIIQADNLDEEYPFKIDFNNGKVTITYQDNTTALIEAELNNGYTSKKEVSLFKEIIEVKEEVFQE